LLGSHSYYARMARLQFHRLLYGDNALFGRDLVDKDVQQRGLAGGHAAGDEDVPSRLNGACDQRISFTADRAKLDEYMTGIYELEQRVQNATEITCNLIDRPPDNLSYPEHVKMMCDLMVLAFQCDVTRVITFMLGNAGSGRNYDFIGVSGGHHEISHHQDVQENFDKLTQIDTWEIEQLAYLLGKLGAVSEGTGTLLDNSIVFFSSEIEDGNSHAHTNLPVLLAGSAGGTLTVGQHFEVPDNTPIANLFLTILSSLGVPDASFGQNSTGPLVLG
jgi:hypothetical protein